MDRDQRKGYSEHPRTPDPYEKIPKRAFDGRIKAWRRQLHKWDIENPMNETNQQRGQITTNEQNEIDQEKKINIESKSQEDSLDVDIDLSIPEEDDDVL